MKVHQTSFFLNKVLFITSVFEQNIFFNKFFKYRKLYYTPYTVLDKTLKGAVVCDSITVRFFVHQVLESKILSDNKKVEIFKDISF